MSESRRNGALLLLLLVVTALIGCNRRRDPANSSAPAPVARPTTGGQRAAMTLALTPWEGSLRLADATSDCGVVFRYRSGRERGLAGLIESLGGGVGLFDYDGDGLLDIFAAGGGDWDGASRPTGAPSSLHRNVGEFRFQDVTTQAGAAADSFFTHGVAAGDFDEDGFVDLLVTGYGGVQLLKNQGDGTFEPATAASKINSTDWTTGAAWGDLNGDGLLDLFVVGYVDWSTTNHRNRPGARPDQLERPAVAPLPPAPDRLYLNRGDGTFQDATAQFALRRDGKGLGVALADIDLDGDLDVFIANDSVQHFFYRNDQPAGRWVETGQLLSPQFDPGADLPPPPRGHGIEVGDYDEDGWPDVWISGGAPSSMSLIRNLGDGDFQNADRTPSQNARQIIAWGAAFADFDLDADLDVVITAGHHLRFPREPQVVKQPTIVLENVVGLTHLDHRYNRIAFRADPYLALEHESRGVAVGDLDDDGDVDIVISHVDGPLTVLRNETVNGNYWLRVKLIGRRGTRDPVGAVVRTTIVGRERVAQVRSGGGYLSSHDRRLTLGAGQVPRVERVEVRWPSGAVQRFDDLPVNQELVVLEP